MKIMIWLLCVILLSGCAGRVSQPSEITLENALEQVGRGLAKMRNAQGDAKTGMIAESAVVTFNIAADSEGGGDLKLDLSAPAVSDGVGVVGNLNSSQSSNRSNVITVTFKNILVIPKDTVGHSLAIAKAGDEVPSGESLKKFIEGLNMRTFSDQTPMQPIDPRSLEVK